MCRNTKSHSARPASGDAPGEHIHLDTAHFPIPNSVVASGRRSFLKAEVMIGTDEFSFFLVGDDFVGSATGDQVAQIYLRSSLYEESSDFTVDWETCFYCKNF